MTTGDEIDNDCDGNIDEEIRDQKDNDGDGLIDEDLALVRRNLLDHGCNTRQMTKNL